MLAALFPGQSATAIGEATQNIPSRALILCARVRFEIVCMLLRRVQHSLQLARGDIVNRYLGSDASPQMGLADIN